jgi:hypothetical protein
MTQLSRPFQIALVALTFFVLVWFVALRGHNSSTSSGASASAPAPALSHRSTTVKSTHATVKRPTSSTAKSAPATVKRPAAAKPHSAAQTIPSMQAAVESELHQGKTVLILFWNPHGADDVAVHQQLQATVRSLGGQVAIHEASASQIGSFGSVTRAIQVYQTPTLLIVNAQGHTTAITGLTDAFSIEQAVSEARKS